MILVFHLKFQDLSSGAQGYNSWNVSLSSIIKKMISINSTNQRPFFVFFFSRGGSRKILTFKHTEGGRGKKRRESFTVTQKVRFMQKHTVGERSTLKMKK